MFTEIEINKIRQIFEHISPNLYYAIHEYSGEEKRFNCITQKTKNNVITHLWIDIEKISNPKLQIIFKRHTEVNKKFFVLYNSNFYRIGFKL